MLNPFPERTLPYPVTGKIQASDVGAMVERFSNGGRDHAPILLKDPKIGLLGIVGSQGFYRLGLHADNRPVVLFSENPQDLDPYCHTDPAFRDKIAPGYWLSNNPYDLKHVKVVEARRRRTDRSWVMEAINEHGKSLKNDKLDYGFLYRVSDRLWVSGAIAYELAFAKTRQPEYQEDALYTLKCYTTAGRGRPFSAINEGISANKIKGTMKLGAVSARVTMAEAEAMIREDFAKRVDLVMREIDPRMMGRLVREPDMHSKLSPLPEKRSDHIKALAWTHAVRLLQGMQAKFNTLKTPSIILTIAKIVYYIGAEMLIRGLRSAITQVFASGVELAEGAMKKPVRNDTVDNAAHTFWAPGTSYTGTAQYRPIDPKQALMIRMMTYEDANIRPDDGAILREGLEPDWPLRSLYNIHDTPAGSIVTMRCMAGASSVHVEQPNGLEIHYLIDHKIRYARYRPDCDHSFIQPLPIPVKELLCHSSGFLKISKNYRDDSLASCRISEDELQADMNREALKPPSPRVRHADLHILNAFNQKAKLEAEPGTQIAMAWGEIQDAIGKVREKAGLPVNESAKEMTPTEAFLYQGLSSRRRVASKSPERPSSNIAPAVVSQPIARP